MSKKKYYVTVQTGEILEEQDVSEYEFEILADEEEVTKLRRLMNEVPSKEYINFWDSHIPYKRYHEDRRNERYDDDLYEIYRTIYELGTEKTREFFQKNDTLKTIASKDAFPSMSE